MGAAPSSRTCCWVYEVLTAALRAGKASPCPENLRTCCGPSVTGEAPGLACLLAAGEWRCGQQRHCVFILPRVPLWSWATEQAPERPEKEVLGASDLVIPPPTAVDS